MLGVKNLRILAAGLYLGVTLTACGGKENPNEIVIGKNIILNYESEVPTGTISYENLDECVKVVTLKGETSSFNRLIFLYKVNYTGGRYRNPHTEVRYTDLKSGITIIDYVDYQLDNEEDYWIVGENLEIIEEICITGYLLQQDFIKREYDVSEIINVSEEKILPTLDSSEKELVK